MKRIFTLCMALLLTAVGTWAQNDPQRIELSTEEQQLVQQNNDFAFRLFRKSRTAESQLLSPLSITYALGMLSNGAQGQTRKEINEVLGFGDAGTDAINRFCGRMLKESAGLDKETKVSIANTVYVNKAAGVHLKRPFVEQAAAHYDATPEERDFYDGKTLDVINQWGSDHTEGMIDQVLTPQEFDPSCITYLLNALYFKGMWQQKFEKGMTMPMYFNDDENTICDLMLTAGQFRFFQNSTYKSIILPYGNGAYQLTVFLPVGNKKLDDVLNELNGKNWNEDAYELYNVDLGFPRFETETSIRLEEVMAGMGMPNAFTGEGFNELCYAGDDESQSCNVLIGLMKQVAKIKLDEEGTEAAAVTVIGTKNGATKYTQFIANRPFLYVISEQSTGAIFFMGQYMGEKIDNPRGSISLTKQEKELVMQNNDFAFNLFRQARTGNNQMLSPLSITYALGMLNNGATGQTQEEISKALGLGEAGAINQFCRKMLSEAPKLDKKTTVGIANTIYVNEAKGYKLKPAFVETAQQYYDATPEARDFNDGLTLDVINQWGNDHTNGMIPKILTQDEFDPTAVSYLLNALYFKGAWVLKFNKDRTKEEKFNNNETVPMMHTGGELLYTENDTYQAVQLPYGNMAYKMTVYLPREGKTVDDLLEKLDSKSWAAGFSNWLVTNLALPRFETNTSQNLVPVMKALGVNRAFNPDEAEFSDFCNVPTFIDLMKQVSKIKVDEEGTEAAAVTVIGNVATGMPREAQFIANRPFLYIISEQSTGVIFFIGQYLGQYSEARETDGICDAPRLNDKEEMINDKYYNLKGQRLAEPPAKGLYIQNGKLKQK